jgi:hypothetical protein
MAARAAFAASRRSCACGTVIALMSPGTYHVTSTSDEAASTVARSVRKNGAGRFSGVGTS